MVSSNIPVSPPTDLRGRGEGRGGKEKVVQEKPHFASPDSSPASTASTVMSTQPFSTGEVAEETIADEETGALPAI